MSLAERKLSPRTHRGNRRRVRRRVSGRSFIYNLRFPGQYYDAETGLSHNGFRDCYDPQTGRYCQPDPTGLAGGINPYSYADNNPISGIDPLGLATLVITSGGYIGNPAGHVALAFTGQGVYSYGTADPYGADTTTYILAALQKRDVTITTLDTTPAQEQYMRDFYKQNYGRFPRYSIARGHECATAALDALGGSGALDSSVLGFLSNPDAPLLPLLPSAVSIAAALQSPSTTTTLKKGSVLPAIYGSFNR
jgi:RHS repeat-associated protein